MTARPSAGGAFKRLQDRIEYLQSEHARLQNRLNETMDKHYKHGRRDGTLQGCLFTVLGVLCVKAVFAIFGA